MSHLKNVAAFADMGATSACGAADPKPEEKPASYPAGHTRSCRNIACTAGIVLRNVLRER